MIAAACAPGDSFGFVFGALVVGALMFAVGFAAAQFKTASDEAGPHPDDKHLCRGGTPASGGWAECPICGPASWGSS